MDEDEKLKISWEELRTSKVEKHVRSQQALERNQRYAQMTAADVSMPDSRAGHSIWYNSIFALAFFGVIGGLLAWAGVALLNLRPDLQHEADQAMVSVQQIRKTIKAKPDAPGITVQQAESAIHIIMISNGKNPYLATYLDNKLSPTQKDERIRELMHASGWKDLLTRIISFGVCGVFISVFLSIAEPVVDRNIDAIVRNASVGAALGLLGGLAASIIVDRIYHAISGNAEGVLRQYLARSVSYGVLGCFLAIGPGVIAQNFKRLWIGALGGLIGGTIGGLAMDPLAQITGGIELGRLVALILIGGVTGAATGIIERAARAGWLKVTSGLIAGKQFILYRNPTFIGSAPDCQIYLFKDPVVGRRHAAIHLLKGRIELENLPLGGPTFVNGKPIARRQLRDSDQINIGSTSFVFQEKTKDFEST